MLTVARTAVPFVPRDSPMQLVLLLSPFTDGETDPESLGRLAGACQRRCQDSALGRERLEPTVLAGAGGWRAVCSELRCRCTVPGSMGSSAWLE